MKKEVWRVFAHDVGENGEVLPLKLPRNYRQLDIAILALFVKRLHSAWEWYRGGWAEEFVDPERRNRGIIVTGMELSEARAELALRNPRTARRAVRRQKVRAEALRPG